MPSVTYEATLTDEGSAALGGSRVFYVAWQITTEGPTIRRPHSWDPNTVIGAGFWQLGNDLTDLGLISAVGWADEHWLYATVGQWIAPPGAVGTDFSAAIAGHIRWTIAPGTAVHLYVFGDV